MQISKMRYVSFVSGFCFENMLWPNNMVPWPSLAWTGQAWPSICEVC